MIYYTETKPWDHDMLMNSLSKGRDDYFEVLRRMGFERIQIPSFKPGRFISTAERLKLEKKTASVWKKKLEILHPGDTLIIHSPNSEKFMAFASLIEQVRARGCKVITIVFELETFFHMDYRRFGGLKRYASVRTERSLFETSDAIVVHNDVMKKRLESIGVDGSKMFSVGVMDYLRDDPLSCEGDERFSLDKPVVFAGNLSAEKSTFEYKLPEGFRCNLYGSDYSGPVNEDVCYKGVYDPVELMDVMEGSFGLVWDGDSVEGCTGSYGNYLTFNNPHKIALYLASGLPVIVWDRSAMAHFVRNENCGIIIRNLYEVSGRIAEMTDSDYEKMRLNACRVGNDMRKGAHIRNAVEMAIARAERNALIVFTREPVAGKTKTRLMPEYSPAQCAELHECFLKDIAAEAKKVDADIFVAYTGNENKTKPGILNRIFREAFNAGRSFEQDGEDLGVRMENAIKRVLCCDSSGICRENERLPKADCQNYGKVILIGTDIPELRAETISDAFAALDSNDVVIGPTSDGGYYLIGMKEAHREAFDVKLYGVDTVFNETVSAIRNSGLSVGIVDTYSDIDEPDDVRALRGRLYEALKTMPSQTHRRLGNGRHQRSPEYCRNTRKFLCKTASISVIVPVYNESDAIDSLLRQLEPFKNEAEIIIVDGGSTDDTVDKTEAFTYSCGFRLIHSPKGRGIQMNAGARESHGDILFFLHCDSVLPSDFIDEIRRCMAESPYGCFGVSFPSRNFFMLTNRLVSNHRARRRGLPFGDQGLFIDRELFFRVGGFPEIPVMEDYEFSCLMKAHGYRPVMTRKRIESSARRYGRGTADILKTELKMWDLRRLYRKGVDPEVLADFYKDER